MNCTAQKYQQGLTILELIIALAVSLLFLTLGANIYSRYLSHQQNRQAAEQLAALGHAVEQYMQSDDGKKKLEEKVKASSGKKFTLSWADLRNYNEFPYPNDLKNSFYQSYQFGFREPPGQAGLVEGLVITSGKDTLSQQNLLNIVSRVGAQGGAIYQAGTDITGAFEAWTTQSNNFNITNVGKGSLAMILSQRISKPLSKDPPVIGDEALYEHSDHDPDRADVNKNYEYMQMWTKLRLMRDPNLKDGQSTPQCNQIDKSTWGSLGANRQGRAFQCIKGVWRSF